MSILFYATMILIAIGVMLSYFSVKVSFYYDKPILAVIITIVYFIVVIIVMGAIYFLKYAVL